jgi:hypothetical protein
MDLTFIEKDGICSYYFKDEDCLFYAIRYSHPSFVFRKDSLEELKDTVNSGMRFWARFDVDTE